MYNDETGNVAAVGSTRVELCVKNKEDGWKGGRGVKVSGRSIRLRGHCSATQCENEKCRIGRKMGEQKPASSKGLETVAGQTGWTTKTRCDYYYYYYYYSCDVLQSRKFRLRRDARILFSSLISRLPPCLFFFLFSNHHVNVNTNIIIHEIREKSKVGETWWQMEDGGTRGNYGVREQEGRKVKNSKN